jgi:hypothetical protein
MRMDEQVETKAIIFPWDKTEETSLLEKQHEGGRRIARGGLVDGCWGLGVSDSSDSGPLSDLLVRRIRRGNSVRRPGVRTPFSEAFR